MLTVLSCLTTEHDWRLVIAAAAVCLIGMMTMLRLVNRPRAASPKARLNRLVTAGAIGGAAIWSTHFIAMLGYQSILPIGYALVPTLASLAIAIGGVTLGLSVAALGGRAASILAGCVLGAATAAMHFVGMASLEVAGDLSWRLDLVVASIVLSALFFSLAFLAPKRMSWGRATLSTGLAVLAICALHFTAMAAVTITPNVAVGGDLAMSQTRIAIGVAIISTFIVAVAGAVGLMSIWSRRGMLAELREAIDAMPDGMGFYDVEDRLVIWNARYVELNPEAAPVLTQGRTFREILQFELDQGHYPEAEGRQEEWLEERMIARHRLSSMLEQRTSDGRWLRVQDRRTSDGGLVTLVNDITDLKNDAHALAQARDEAEAANRAKSEFLANMSHEIRTPLNGVIGVAQALEQTRLDASQTEMLALIRSSSETLQHLLSDILDLARVESGRIDLRSDPFDLVRAVEDAAQLYAASASEKGLQFFVEIDDEARVWVEGDVTRLKQVLTNLVSNAVKFTHDGFVSLTLGRVETAKGPDCFRFSVTDTGVGFDAAARDRLFTRFEQADGTITRRFGGTGLGLAICRQLAEMMGGDLDCESELGGGSTFILTLPLAEVAQQDTLPIAPSDDASSARRISVLLADDHPVNRKVVELILAQIDAEIVSVENGAEAVEAFRARPFDIVLMDMQMPVMDGLTATREIRLHETAMGQSPAPVIMLTANALPEHIQSAEAAGADRHLAKPINAGQLIETMLTLSGARDTAIAA